MRAGSNEKRRRRRRRLLVVLASIPLLVLTLWIAIHKIPWLGPLLADSARAVIGPTAVAKVEDFAYGIQDRFNRFWRKSDAPEAYWDVPTASPSPAAPAGSSPASRQPAFRPVDVAPMHASWSAPGDGSWVPVPDPRRPEEQPRMYKTLLHPDRNRSWTAVSMVAIDLRQVELHLVAGRYEPESLDRPPPTYERRAIIPEDRHETLLAAFNGGFKTTHGHHGMRIDGITLVKPRQDSCTIALFDDGHIEVRSWPHLKDRETQMRWWRQAPQCMAEVGQLHKGLVVDSNTFWGSTIEGSTVIRRSAVGISADGQTLYVGIGDSTTAPAIARAMRHVGAHSVAQLDVNWSYPKFVVYEPRSEGSSELVAKPLCKGFEFSEDEYIRQRAQRDFFYLTRRSPPS